jgi:hypothetical protein
MTSEMIFLSIPELKIKLELAPLPDAPSGRLDFVVNPNTNKLFAVGITKTGSQVKVKTEQAIDPSLPVKFMYSPDAFDEGCIVNVTPVSAPKFSL